jgi:hypothetical protein
MKRSKDGECCWRKTGLGVHGDQSFLSARAGATPFPELRNSGPSPILLFISCEYKLQSMR